MVNEGRLAPVVDVVQALRDEAAGGGKGGGGKGGGGADDIAKTGGNKSASKKDVSREGTMMGMLDVMSCREWFTEAQPNGGRYRVGLAAG